MNKVSRARLAQGAARLMHSQPARQRAITQAVASYLVLHGRTHEAGLVARDIAQALTKLSGELEAETYSTFKLGPSAKHNIETLLKNVVDAKTVRLREHLQPDLIGGVLIRTNTHELDATIAGQLRRLTGDNS